MTGITYDTGALIAAEANDRSMWLLHRQALRRGLRPVVPAGVLAQAWRGGPQHQLSRFLKGCHIEDMTAPVARAAGVACGRARSSDDVVDASVVVGAAARGDAVITSDGGDLEHIASSLDVALVIRTVDRL